MWISKIFVEPSKLRESLKGCPRGVMVKALHCGIVVSSNSSRAITFTFGQIPFTKVWTLLILPAVG